MKRFLPLSIGFLLLVLVGFLFFQRSHFASAATANHVVISEIQLAGNTASDDFIELYNPTSADIDISNYMLVKRSSSGSADTSIKSFDSNTIIPAYGYFLWCNNNFSGSISCDASTSATIADNNSVGLRNGDVNTGALVDAVSFDTVTNTLGEGSSLTAPSANSSVERKAKSSSTILSMIAGGIDELFGNSEDTENNSADFIVRTNPQPQNKASGAEILTLPTPTNTPTSTPSVSPSITLSPTPSITATPTPSVTPTPIVLPTATPTATPSLTPTTSPTVSPILTPTATPTPTLTSPTPTPNVIVRGPIFTCTLNYTGRRFFGMLLLIPRLSCVRTSI